MISCRRFSSFSCSSCDKKIEQMLSFLRHTTPCNPLPPSFLPTSLIFVIIIYLRARGIKDQDSDIGHKTRVQCRGSRGEASFPPSPPSKEELYIEPRQHILGNNTVVHYSSTCNSTKQQRSAIVCSFALRTPLCSGAQRASQWEQWPLRDTHRRNVINSILKKKNSGVYTLS